MYKIYFFLLHIILFCLTNRTVSKLKFNILKCFCLLFFKLLSVEHIKIRGLSSKTRTSGNIIGVTLMGTRIFAVTLTFLVLYYYFLLIYQRETRA